VTVPGAPVFPPGRYGRRREPGRIARWLPGLLSCVLVLVVIWIALYLYGRYGDNPYQGTVLSYSVISDSRLEVSLQVQKPADHPATCRVQAKDGRGGEVGYAEVRVAGGANVQLTYALATKGRAVTVDVLGCRAAPR
jgi:hypothetical protein